MHDIDHSPPGSAPEFEAKLRQLASDLREVNDEHDGDTKWRDLAKRNAAIVARKLWAWLRRFHAAGAATLAATPSLAQELVARGFCNVKQWPRGVDATLFRPRVDSDLGCRDRSSSASAGWRWKRTSRLFSRSICLEQRSWSVPAPHVRR
jgi:hypothetical protein